jgi:hypothetical protein
VFKLDAFVLGGYVSENIKEFVQNNFPLIGFHSFFVYDDSEG